jgi:hypothetical protein
MNQNNADKVRFINTVFRANDKNEEQYEIRNDTDTTHYLTYACGEDS